MAAEDYMDFDFDDDQEYWSPGWRQWTPKVPSCNRCGSYNVRWAVVGGRWSLREKNQAKPHVCQADPSELFEDLGDSA